MNGQPNHFLPELPRPKPFAISCEIFWFRKCGVLFGGFEGIGAWLSPIGGEVVVKACITSLACTCLFMRCGYANALAIALTLTLARFKVLIFVSQGHSNVGPAHSSVRTVHDGFSLNIFNKQLVAVEYLAFRTGCL